MAHDGNVYFSYVEHHAQYGQEHVLARVGWSPEGRSLHRDHGFGALRVFAVVVGVLELNWQCGVQQKSFQVLYL